MFAPDRMLTYVELDPSPNAVLTVVSFVLYAVGWVVFLWNL